MTKRKKKNKNIEELMDELLVSAEEYEQVKENWVWVRLGSVCEFKRGPFGSAIKKSMFVHKGEGTYKVYEQGNAIRKTMNYGDYYISRENFENLKGFEVNEGDIIVSCAGTIGETYIIPSNHERGVINQALMRVKTSKVLDKGYFLYAFDYYIKQLAKDNAKGSAIKNLPPLAELKQYVISLPPLNEQKRIVEKVEFLLNKIDKAKQLINEAKETFNLRRAAILDKGFRGELTKKWHEKNDVSHNVSHMLKIIKEERANLNIKFKSNETPVKQLPFDVPEKWEWVSLGDIVLSFKNGLYKSAEYYADNGVPCLRMYNINKGALNFIDMHYMNLTSEEIEEYGLKYGDVLINRVNSRELVGKSAPVPKEFPVCVYESKNIRARLSKHVNPYYIGWCLELPYVRKLILESSKQTVGMATVNQGFLKSVPVPLPSLEEQNEIVKQISLLLDSEKKGLGIIENIELENIKQAILSKAFRGELGTNDPSEESAIELLKEVLQEQVK
ncbi:hypothetical protein COL65_02435 [Priestia aryabhattai]|uniref:restriction endonuclease subunit S n=1 Tax=Priestia aryabhattai TaxID=412384 RepID=UPI000BF6D41F|nr:restriction endonuclease subunit S [Priestia aryabhattai]PGA21966.1 hypothetical protein COL65_02435 [Priestia aryabhattai]